MFQFEELDETTRRFMLEEFKAEESGTPYRSPRLSPHGLQAFPTLMEEAIRSGNEETLSKALSNPSYWNPHGPYIRANTGQKPINPVEAAEVLAITEFNIWYVRGLAKRLLEEGEHSCQVYRAAPAKEPRGECLKHDGKTYPLQDIYDGHRARYWPKPGKPGALSIPIGPNCHHTIRRVRRETSDASQ